MKITPILASQAGNPSQSLTPATDGRTSPDRIAAAKAVANGQSNIRVTESDTPTDPQVKRAQETIRRIKMKTNASPERFDSIVEDQQELADPTKSAISDTNEPAQTVEETKPLSPQFAALARQKRALQVKEREIADREKALESRGTESSKSSDELVAKLKSQPLSVLQEYGVLDTKFYNELTESLLNNQSGLNPEIQALRNEIKALKEGVDKNLTDRDVQAEQQVLSEMKREAVLLAKAGDDFEMVRETNSVPDVIELIHRTYKESGEILEVQEAMQLVEDDLINETLKIANLKKVQSRITPAQELKPQPDGKQMKTLTNRDTARPQSSRRDRMIAAFNGTLKK